MPPPAPATPRSPAGCGARSRARRRRCPRGSRRADAASPGNPLPRRSWALRTRALWAPRVPSTPGMPRPMTVRQATIEGRGSDFACWIAAPTASGSWPSTSCTCQPLTRKRAGMSSASAMSIAPSSVIRLSSQRKMSLPRRRCPASEITSCADTLLQAAVADQSVGAVIDDRRSEPFAQESLGDRHPGRVGDALPEQAGGHLDAAARVIFRMALAVRPEHPEPLDLLDAHLLVAGQVEQR